MPVESSVQPRRSNRPRHKPQRLDDYQCANANKRTSPHGIEAVLSYDHLPTAHMNFVLSVTEEPKPYEQAILHGCWREAMQKEIAALEENNTWTITDLPTGKTPIGCKWVFKIKYHADGTIERHKARLVAKGYTQQHGVDYLEIFSPVASITTIRTMLAEAVAKGWIIQQLDVNNAFLHGDLNEEVYMKLPPGFQAQSSKQVCKLTRSLYGLKQASRQWNAKLTQALLSMGFSQAVSDPSLFTQVTTKSFTAVLAYVDDLIIAGDSMESIQRLKQFLNDTFKIKDLGCLKYFLGIEACRTSEGLNICQRKYALDILKEAGFT